MKFRMSVLVFLTVVASAFAQVADSELKKDDPANKIMDIDIKQRVAGVVLSGEIENLKDVECLVTSKEYVLAIIDFDISQSGLQATCSATTDSTPASTFGAILYRSKNNEWETVKTLGWELALDQAKFKDFTLRISFDELGKQDGKYRLMLYRSNNLGKLMVYNIRLQKWNDTAKASGK